MNKKVLLIVLIAFICTGFTTKHTIKIEDDKVTDNVIIEFPENAYELAEESMDEEYANAALRYLYSDFQVKMLYGEGIYNKKIEEKRNKILVNLDYTFNLGEYIDSKLINMCFKEVIVEDEENYYSISLRSYTDCYYEEAEEIQFILDTPHQIYDHNADEYKGGKYIWKINDENMDEANVAFVLLKNIKDRGFKISGFEIFFFCLLIVISGAIIGVSYKISKSRNI